MNRFDPNMPCDFSLVACFERPLVPLDLTFGQGIAEASDSSFGHRGLAHVQLLE